MVVVTALIILGLYWGPSIKYVTLEGEGVREGGTVCDGEGVQEHVTSRLEIFYHTYET